MNTIKQIAEWFANSDDVHLERMPGESRCHLIYADGMIDHTLLNEFIRRPFAEQPDAKHLPDKITVIMQPLEAPSQEEIVSLIFSGYAILMIDNETTFYMMNIANIPRRNPSETNTEASIRGPRDGFIEDLSANVALLRKRLRTQTLAYEGFLVGTRSKTKVALIYIDDIIEPQLVEEARKRIKDIEIEALVSGAQMEELIADSPWSIMPLLDYSGRPDFVVEGLLIGRFAILVDGSPNAILAPANFMLLLKSSEDAHAPFAYVSFERMIRLVAFLNCILMPGFWVALISFHQEQLPFHLLATIMLTRQGVPMSVAMEAFVILALFEILREAGARLPKAIGQTLAVVGGLIIGDAAIRSGLTSPSLVVIIAIATISMFVLINQSLSGAASLLRIGVLLISSLFGLYGFFLAICAFALYMANLTSFGIPYLAPIAPFEPGKVLSALFKSPALSYARRPGFLKPRKKKQR